MGDVPFASTNLAEYVQRMKIKCISEKIKDPEYIRRVGSGASVEGRRMHEYLGSTQIWRKQKNPLQNGPSTPMKQEHGQSSAQSL
jgi:hypothetical protein